MTTVILIALVILLLAQTAFYFFVLKKPKNENTDAMQSGMNLLLQQLNELSRTVDTKMSESQKMMSESVTGQFDRSQDLIRKINEQVTNNLIDVSKSMTEAREASKQVFSMADQLKNLEKVLKHQKQRGALGEANLELILSNILPPTAYTLQYEFKNGDRVDAAILTKDGVIPVDAKFSLDNYQRLVTEEDEIRKEELEKEFRNDLKKRIDETAKYIRPGDKTLPFAIMFIPAEGIFYDLLTNEVGSVKSSSRSLIDYAYNEKHVVIVSPTTFAAYLQSVLFGFRAFKIEESAQQIRGYVEDLQRHLKNYEEYFVKMGNSLSTVVNHYSSAGKEFRKIDKDVLRITGKSNVLDLPDVEKPRLED